MKSLIRIKCILMLTKHLLEEEGSCISWLVHVDNLGYLNNTGYFQIDGQNVMNTRPKRGNAMYRRIFKRRKEWLEKEGK